jgi:hypothetical protein
VGLCMLADLQRTRYVQLARTSQPRQLLPIQLPCRLRINVTLPLTNARLERLRAQRGVLRSIRVQAAKRRHPQQQLLSHRKQ